LSTGTGISNYFSLATKVPLKIAVVKGNGTGKQIPGSGHPEADSGKGEERAHSFFRYTPHISQPFLTANSLVGLSRIIV